MTTLTIDETVGPGGATSTQAAIGALGGADRATSGTLDYELSGASTDVDVHVEARTAPDMAFKQWSGPYNGDASAGDQGLTGIDLEALHSVRLRVVNNDGTNDATVAAQLVVTN
jgi:hypothetical protein